METLYLIARIGEQRIALAAQAILSVVEIDSVTPVPAAPRHIAGLAALRSRVLTVIDTCAALRLESAWQLEHAQAVVVAVEGHLYGLLVDEVEDVIDSAAAPCPVKGTLAPGWGQVAIGMIEHAGEPILVVDAAALSTGSIKIAA